MLTLIQRTTYRIAKLGLLMSYSSDLTIQKRLKPNKVTNGHKIVFYT